MILEIQVNYLSLVFNKTPAPNRVGCPTPNGAGRDSHTTEHKGHVLGGSQRDGLR